MAGSWKYRDGSCENYCRPDSTQIAYQETDHKGVEVWYVADPANPGRQPQPFFYPRPGKANARVKLGVVPALGGNTTWIAWDDTKYPYLAMVRWQHAAPLLLLVQTRDQKEMTLLEADLKTGKTNRLLTERSSTPGDDVLDDECHERRVRPRPTCALDVASRLTSAELLMRVEQFLDSAAQ